MKLFAAILCLAVAAHAQNAGDQNPAADRQITIQKCSGAGSCSQESAYVILDSNWRWTHHVDDYVNCYTGNEWDSQFCPDAATCTEQCALDTVPDRDWEGTYGITANGDSISLKFVTQGPYSKNVGSRVFLGESASSYKMFQLLDMEITFDVDDSQLDCGLNGALYTVEMDQDGGMSKYPTNKAGAAYGTGYCDAQCPHDMKWISGEANCDDWTPSDNDENSGTGKYGICCMEMDLWEANRKSQAYTTHPCDLDEPAHRCEGEECGDNERDRYGGVCDKDGCDFASYRWGDTQFWGEGSSFAVDSTQKTTVVTQFLSEGGKLSEVRRFYVQNGQQIENSVVSLGEASVDGADSLTEDFCTNIKTVVGDVDDHGAKGGLAKIGESLARGHVFVMSLWDDHDANMLWLDSNYPTDGDPSSPGIARGPCPTSSGVPADVESQQGDATVTFSNIRYGPIGSTTGF